MFTDPQEVTVNAQAKSLPRVAIGSGEATFRSADEVFQLRISHQASKGRKRHMIRLDQTVIAADPLTAENASQKAGVYLVIDEPTFGFSDTELEYIVTALTDWLATAGFVAKVLGGES